jgi:hypothetical protein
MQRQAQASLSGQASCSTSKLLPSLLPRRYVGNVSKHRLQISAKNGRTFVVRASKEEQGMFSQAFCLQYSAPMHKEAMKLSVCLLSAYNEVAEVIP